TGLRNSPLLDLSRTRAATLIIGAAEDRLATPHVVAQVHDSCAAPIRRTCTVRGGHEDVTAANPRVRACIDDFLKDLPSGIAAARQDGEGPGARYTRGEPADGEISLGTPVAAREIRAQRICAHFCPPLVPVRCRRARLASDAVQRAGHTEPSLSGERARAQGGDPDHRAHG